MVRQQAADDEGLPKTLREAFDIARRSSIGNRDTDVASISICRMFSADCSIRRQMRLMQVQPFFRVKPQIQVLKQTVFKVVDTVVLPAARWYERFPIMQDCLWGRDLKLETVLTVPPPVCLDADVQRWYPAGTVDTKAGIERIRIQTMDNVLLQLTQL